jgi:hypothetical protein
MEWRGDGLAHGGVREKKWTDSREHLEVILEKVRSRILQTPSILL